MKKICLIRHAKSDWGHEGLEDIDRPLNARGYEDAKSMAMRLNAAGIQPEGIVSSTAIRAASTALIFVRTLGIDETHSRFTPSLYEANEETFLKVIRKLPEEWNTVFVFGHNPSITDIVNRLGREQISNIPTCGIVMLEANTTSWSQLDKCKLLFFDYPKNAEKE
jgi:phosphohistidine phosphatase